jgi:type II secretory pathway component PulJ
MRTLERYGPPVRLLVNLAAVLYLVFSMFHSAAAQSVTVEQRVIENRQRIEGLERRMDRLDRDLERLDIAQRLTKIEAYIQAAKESSESNRQLLRAIVGGVALMLLETVIRTVGAVRRPRG